MICSVLLYRLLMFTSVAKHWWPSGGRFQAKRKVFRASKMPVRTPCRYMTNWVVPKITKYLEKSEGVALPMCKAFVCVFLGFAMEAMAQRNRSCVQKLRFSIANLTAGWARTRVSPDGRGGRAPDAWSIFHHLLVGVVLAGDVALGYGWYGTVWIACWISDENLPCRSMQHVSYPDRSPVNFVSRNQRRGDVVAAKSRDAWMKCWLNSMNHESSRAREVHQFQPIISPNPWMYFSLGGSVVRN